MKVLVTGGAGYVGSLCVRELCEHGHEVVVLDNLSAGHRAAVDERAGFVCLDLRERARLERLFEDSRFDGVMHFAGSINVGESARIPLAYYRNNVTNTLSLLEIMRNHGVKNLVFSSTCAVYGTPPAVPIREDMPTGPISPYGRTKLAAEWALEDSARSWGLSATALRYFNASGAAADGSVGEDHRPETHLLPLVLEVALGKRERIDVYGADYPTRDGTCVRDYVHVEDLAVVHRLAIERASFGEFRAFNVGTGRGVSVREIIDTARSVTGASIPSVDRERRPGDPAELYADAAKVQATFGWTPRYVEVRDIVESAWRWHSRNPHGYRD